KSFLRVNSRADARSNPKNLLQFYCPPERCAWGERLLGRRAVKEAFDRFRVKFEELTRQPRHCALRSAECGMSLAPLLERADHILMAESIEGRTPFLHGMLPRFALSMDRKHMLRRDQTKPMLRRVADIM